MRVLDDLVRVAVTDSARSGHVGGPTDAQAEIAEDLGVTSSALALAGLRARPGTVLRSWALAGSSTWSTTWPPWTCA